MPRRELVENTGVNSGPSKSSTNWNPNSLRRFLVEPIPFKKRLKDTRTNSEIAGCLSDSFRQHFLSDNIRPPQCMSYDDKCNSDCNGSNASRAREGEIVTFLPVRKESGVVSAALSLRNMRDRIPMPLRKSLSANRGHPGSCAVSPWKWIHSAAPSDGWQG